MTAGMDLPRGIVELLDPLDHLNHLWRQSDTMMRSLCGECGAYRTSLLAPTGVVARCSACLLALGMLLAGQMSTQDKRDYQRGF